MLQFAFFFFSSRRRHTTWTGDWSSDVCSSDLQGQARGRGRTPPLELLGGRRGQAPERGGGRRQLRAIPLTAGRCCRRRGPSVRSSRSVGARPTRRAAVRSAASFEL